MARSAESRTAGSRRERSAAPSLSPERLSRPALRLLAALAEEGTSAVPDPLRDDGVIVRSGRSPVSLGRGQHGGAALRELRDRDLLQATADGRPGHASISRAGRGHLARHEAAGTENPFAAQHREVASAQIAEQDGIVRVSVNALESPLAWLRRRRDRDGEPLIDAASFEAGERLRRDVTAAGMLPGVTSRWEGGIGGGGGALRDPAAATDAVIAARQRVRAALARVGGDFADLLIDLCGFLKGLEAIERDRGWPPRSGKVVVRLALRQLARHYGLETEARGPASSRGVRSWSAALEEAA